MKTKHRILSALLALAVIFTMLPAAMIPAAAKTVVAVVDINVCEPKIGEPVDFDTVSFLTGGYRLSTEGGARYDGITWLRRKYDNPLYTEDPLSRSSHPVFERGYYYMCIVSLITNDTDTVFSTTEKLVAEDTVWYEPAVTVSFNDHDTFRTDQRSYNHRNDKHNEESDYLRRIYVSYEFPLLTEEILSCKVYLDEPVADGHPDYTPVIPEGAMYTVTQPEKDAEHYVNGVQWWDETDKKSVGKSDAFIEGHRYFAYIIFTANETYSFGGIGASSLPMTYVNSTLADCTSYSVDVSPKKSFMAKCDFGECTQEVIDTASVIAIKEPRPTAQPSYEGICKGAGYTFLTNSTYKNGIAWYDKTTGKYLDYEKDEKFISGHEYRVSVLLFAKEGFEFAVTGLGESAVSCFVNGQAAQRQSYGTMPKKFVNFSYDYGECKYTTINIVAIEELESPKPGKAPDCDVTVMGSSTSENASYKVDSTFTSNNAKNGIFWHDDTTNDIVDPDNDTFIEGHKYHVNITLTPQAGYRFAKDNYGKSALTGTITGGSASFTDSMEPAVDRVFARRDYVCQAIEVDKYSLAVTQPYTGKKPEFKASSYDPVQYDIATDFSFYTGKNGVAWYDTNEGNYLTENDTFVSGHKYKVYVFVVPQTGYTFKTSTLSGRINGNESIWSQSAKGLADIGGIMAQYTFGATEEAPKKMLTMFTVTDVVPPCPDMHPSYTATAGDGTFVADNYYTQHMAGYHSGIAWYDHTDKRYLDPEDVFIKDHEYTCDVVLETDEDHLFSVNTDGNGQLSGTFNGKDVIGRANVGVEAVRQHYICTWLTFTSCRNEMLHFADISEIVKPCAGETPFFVVSCDTIGESVDTTVLDERYHYGVAWLDMTEFHYLEPEETFIKDHEYRMEVVLNADPGYEFYLGGKSLPQVNATFNGEKVSAMFFSGKPMEKTIVVYGDFGKCKAAPDAKYSINVINGAASIGGSEVTSAAFGEVVTIAADPLTFDHWECSDAGVDIDSVYSYETTLLMPANDITVTAVQKAEQPDVNITVVGGRALDKEGNEITKAKFGQKVYLSWNAPQEKKFLYWSPDTNSVDIDDITSPETGMLVPKNDVTIHAVEENEGEAKPMYGITVNGGKAVNAYFAEITSAHEGETVTLIWNTSEDRTFLNWSCDDSSVVIADASSQSTTFTMPDHAVEITANDKEKSESATAHSIKVNGGAALNDYLAEITSAHEGDTVKLAYSPTPSKQFVGWKCDSPVSIDNAALEATTFTMPDHDVEFTAQEQDIPAPGTECYVTYHGNNESGDKKTVSVEKGSKLKLPECFFKAPEGYEFDKWSEGAPGDEITVNGDMTIYAHWKEIPPELITKAECTITPPKAHANPDMHPVSAEPEKYEIEVSSWYLNDANVFPEIYAYDTFEKNNFYNAALVIKPKAGYTAAPSTELYVNGTVCVKTGPGVYEATFFVPDEETLTGIYGDEDLDTTITAGDALTILRASAGLEEFDALHKKIGDVDEDGEITASDALGVLRYSVGLSAPEKVGQPF